MMLWQAYITDNWQQIAAKLLQGLFRAPIESLAEITVSHVVCIFKRCKHDVCSTKDSSSLLTSVAYTWLYMAWHWHGATIWLRS